MIDDYENIVDDAEYYDEPDLEEADNTKQTQKEKEDLEVISGHFVDRRAILQVLGCLMKDPALIASSGFRPGDFILPFYELIFEAILTLYGQGAQTIDEFGVDHFCNETESRKKIYYDNQGLDYIRNCLSLSDPQNFKVYSSIVKKYACLYKLKSQGLDVRVIYNYDANGPREKEKQHKKFADLTVEDILNNVETKLVNDLREQYQDDSRHDEFTPGEGLDLIKEEWKKTPDFGLPFHNQKILTTIVRGARLGTVSIYSGGTGTGKTRMGYGRMCGLSIPWYYNWEEDEFEYHEGLDHPCLIIQTELTRTENQSLILAYVSGVDESVIRTGKYESKHQENVVDKSIDYIKQSPMYLDIITDFSISDIERIIRKYNRLYGCQYFFLDYLQLVPTIASEMAGNSGGLRSREDLVMLFAITRLKNLANELGIYLYTSTQLNNSYKDAGTFVDQSALRSAKSLADKIDVGDIMLPPSEAELKATKEFMREGLVVKPNIVNHIYKCRGTKFSKLKLFQKADLGTCRVRDLFCTNINNVLMDVPVWDVEISKRPGKSDEKKAERIIDSNSVDLGTMSGEEILNTINPNVSTTDLDKLAEFDPELNTNSHNALRDMGF